MSFNGGPGQVSGMIGINYCPTHNAAPDLLAALKEMVVCHEVVCHEDGGCPSCRELAKARALIAEFDVPPAPKKER